MPTQVVAKELIGKMLVKVGHGEQPLAGIIVETEAYLSAGDGASHSAPGLTQRNRAMFARGGILYVYKIYGVHHCVNVVTEAEGVGCAVLLRAIQPVSGIDAMINNRSTKTIESLCKGPGNLARAFGFTRQYDFASLLTDKLFIQKGLVVPPEDIVTGSRVGIKKSADLQLRFYLKNSSCVSKKH